MKTFKYRLYPTKKQIEFFELQLNAHRFLYNSALEHKILCYKKYNKYITCYDQTLSLKEIRNYDEQFINCNYSSLQQTLRRLDKAYKAFFSRIKKGETPGFPRFKNKNQFNTIQYASIGDGCQIKNNKLYLQNIGEIKVKWHRKIEGKIKTLYVTRKNDKYYVNFFVENVPNILPKTGKQIGIDVGIEHFLVTSDELYIDSPKYLRESEPILKMRSQRLCRRKKGSERRDKAKKLVAKIHEKIANQRLDFVHKITTMLVKENDVIVIEKLQIQNMVKNKHLAKNISDAGWGMFFQILKYKAENAGKKVIEINSKGTSQICSVCGNVVKKSLSIRIHNCPFCFSIMNRDLNASINILNKAWVEPSVLTCF
jgi:putative transposase